jgi:hypothetical protein
MSGLEVGIAAMGGMKPMGQGLLPPWVTWLWLVALAAVLVVHCGHLARMGGQRRWYHASHILMLVSMLYMFASMEFRWKWFPSSWSVVIFVVSTAAVVAWMAFRFVEHRRFSLLWLLALIMQASMIYMWMPSWAPALTWTLVVYFGLEAAARLAGLPHGATPAVPAALPGGASPAMPSGLPGAGPTKAAGSPGSQPAASVGLLEAAEPAMPSRVGRRAAQLAHDSLIDRLSMAVMAASMGYMFAAMQLMR